MNKIRVVAQVVGFCTMGLLALYGLLALCGVAGPLGLAAVADAGVPNTPGEAAAVLGSDIPQTMNYQGFLRNPDGSLTTGPYTITARIYDVGVSTITETVFYTTTVPNVTVRDGLFNIVLGDDPPLPADAFSDVERYIGIDLNDGGGELIPRQRLHAVPWAFTATTLVDNAPAQSVQGLSVSGGITVTEGLSVTGGLTVDPKPVLIMRIENIPDHTDWNTEIDANIYDCVATGWSALYDIAETSAGGYMVWTHVRNSEWYVKVWFNSQNDHEQPDVDILCFRKGIVEWACPDSRLDCLRELDEPN